MKTREELLSLVREYPSPLLLDKDHIRFANKYGRGVCLSITDSSDGSDFLFSTSVGLCVIIKRDGEKITVVSLNSQKSFTINETEIGYCSIGKELHFIKLHISNESAITYLKKRGVQYLVHFTALENLVSIFPDGIRSRKEQFAAGTQTDTKRLEGNTGATSYSISFPNYQMLYRKMQSMPRTVFAVLLIDIDALSFLPSESVAYYSKNAASQSGLSGMFNTHTGIDNLMRMFESTNIDSRNSCELPQWYTINPQAELLITGAIPSVYIKRIALKCNEHLEIAKSLFPNYSSFICDNRLFQTR